MSVRKASELGETAKSTTQHGQSKSTWFNEMQVVQPLKLHYTPVRDATKNDIEVLVTIHNLNPYLTV